MEKYMDMKERHQAEFNKFPMQFAFSQEQFDEGMKKLGLDPSETDKVYSYGMGGFFLKDQSPILKAMVKRHNEEFEKAIKDDTDGTGFIYEMFIYELANHEYGYTMDTAQTLEALDLTMDIVNNNPALKHGLELAKKKYREAI